jgi:uncharacterized zinc-type alcohol dehydrogenase-like protein
MSHVHAYSVAKAKGRLEPVTIERREPGPGDVEIDIKYCGICHSDLHQVGDEWGGSAFPMVPGHEIAGIVSRVGPGVSEFAVGDRVGVGCFVDSVRSKGGAERDRDIEQYLPGTLMTYNGLEADGKTRTMGGYSERIVVNEKFIMRVPDAIPLDRAAPLMCAGITLYSPLRHWKAGPGTKVAIVGLGGLGHMGVKIAHAMGAEVTVLSHSLAKKADGIALGADAFYATSDPATFRKLRNTFDLVINTVSAKIDWNALLSLLKIDGTLVILGIPEEEVPIDAFSLVGGRRSLAGSMIGSIAETQEMLDFCAAHGVVPEIEVIPIEDVNEAYERVRKSDVRYRFVIDTSTFSKN